MGGDTNMEWMPLSIAEWLEVIGVAGRGITWGKNAYRRYQNTLTGKISMAFHAPSFNLLADIWHAVDYIAAAPVTPPDVALVVCNLQMGRKISGSNITFMNVLLPALTDVRRAQ